MATAKLKAFDVLNACEAYQAKRLEKITTRRLALVEDYKTNKLRRFFYSIIKKQMPADPEIIDILKSERADFYNAWDRAALPGCYWADIVNDIKLLCESSIARGDKFVILSADENEILKEFF